jgi:hypothetical protein
MTDDGAEPEVGAMENLAQRRDDVARLERPGRGLGQERRVEREVDVVDEHQPRRLLRQQLLELTGAGRAREAASGDDDVPGHALSMALSGDFVTVCYKRLKRRP